MAKTSVIEMALAKIDADIAALQRAKDIITEAAARGDVVEALAKPKRGRRKKGLPVESDGV